MESPLSNADDQMVGEQILKLKENDDEKFKLFNGEDDANKEERSDLINSEDVTNNEEKENEEEHHNKRSTEEDDEQMMDSEENELNQDCPMEEENDECMKRRIRLRNDLNKRKLRHLNKRREQSKHMKKSEEDGEESLDEDNEQMGKELSDRDNEPLLNNQSSNIVDLLTRDSALTRSTGTENELQNNDVDDEDDEESSIKKASAYLGLQRLIQLFQQQQSSSTNLMSNQEDEAQQSASDNQIESDKSDDQAKDNDNQASSQQQSDQSIKADWLLNAASATFPLEKSQSEILAKQSPALLHQQLMMVQLLQQIQQQAVNEKSSNEEERLNHKTFDDEPMDCDQAISKSSPFDHHHSHHQKSKLNFGNLIPSTSSQHSSSITSSYTTTTGAPVPTRPAHTMTPVCTSSSLFSSASSSAATTTSSSINSINNQLNRLNPLHHSQNSTRSNPIENLILMPDDPSSTADEPAPSTKNPLAMLEFTAEKALQKTMKGASFLVNSCEGEEDAGKCDDPSNRHRCKFCEKVFGSDSALQIHIRSHTGERPFKCNVCGNRFSTKGNLKVHFARHSTKYPHVKMNTNPIPENMDKFFPPIEPPGSSQSPPAQFQPEDDLLSNVNSLGLNFAQGLAAAAANQHSLALQKQRQQQQQQQQQLQDMSFLANLSADRLDSFSRELLLATTSSSNFLLKNSSSLSACEKQLRELTSRSPAVAAKQEPLELEDSSLQDSANESKQRKSNESMDVLSTADCKVSISNVLLNANSSASPSTSNHHHHNRDQLQRPNSSTSPSTFGQFSSTTTATSSVCNKESVDSSDETVANNMLDYLLKSKQRKSAQSDNNQSSKTSEQSDKSANTNNNTMNSLLSELSQQQFNPNLAATIAAAQAASSLFSFLPANLHPNLYQQLPQYLSSLLQHQLPFSAQPPPSSVAQLNSASNSQNITNNLNSSSSTQMDAVSTVASLLNSQHHHLPQQQQSANRTSPNNNGDLLDSSCNQSQNNNQNNLIKNSSTASPNHHHASPLQQNLLGTVLNNLNNSMMTNRSSTGGRNSPNSSLNSAHDFDLNSVLSSSPRNSPNIRQQLSQLAALTASTSSSIMNNSAAATAHHHLISSPAHHSASTPNPMSNNSNNSVSAASMNAYQDLLPKPGSTDNAWETLMEVEKDSEAAKLKKLVENSDQKITDPNQCVICQRILSCKSALQMHYRVHTGERPFKCRLCQRAFTTKGNLKTHMSVHRQKPSLRSLHECPVCRQQFTNALVLQQHVKQMHNQPDERQLIQAHQKAQQQLQYAAAMERMLMAAHQQKSVECGNNGSDHPLSGLPTNFNFADDPFFASLNPANFNLAQLQALQSMAADRQSSSMDENSFQEAAQQFLSQNGRLNMMSGGLKEDFDDDEYDEKDDDMMNDSKDCEEDDLANENARPNQDSSELDKDEELLDDEEDDEMLQKDDSTDLRNSSPNNNASSNQISSLQEQIDNMNEDSIASTLSSTAGAIDLTPKQQQVVAAHLQQIKNIQQQQTATQVQQQLNSSNGSHSSSGCSSSNQQMLNNLQTTMPTFQLSARGANTTCKICMKTFACNSALEIHYRSHTKERPFKCTICERGFSTKGNMKQHLLTHKLRDFPPNVLGPNISVSGNNQLSSLMLNAAAAAASAINNGNVFAGLNHHHQNLINNSLHSNHHSPTDLTQSFLNATKANNELNGLKDNLDLAGVINSANGMGENCLLKSSSSSTSNGSGASKSHRHLSQFQQLQQNGDCQSDASCEANEEEHRRSVNSANGGVQPYERSSSAVNSESSSSSILNLTNSEQLKRINNLTNSISSNLTASLSTANGCASTSSTSVNNGQTSGELKHMCEICVKPFSSHSALQIHLRTHTGDKPFKCSLCGRPFTTKGNLKVHMGTHMGGMSGMGSHILSPANTNSRRGRRMSLEVNFPNFMMESNNWIN